jgi:HAE1 family hydrophobic/amphiphilic exporter-1/multidrug efflux pump
LLSKFFINRPRFSTVIAIIIILAGLISLKTLPVKEYPTLTPPQVTLTAFYPGATAETISETVAAPLEEAINGVENMIYMTSTASSSGSLRMSIFFKIGTDSDVAKMNVNNRVQTALPKLPEEVRRLGVNVRERSPDLLKVICFVSEHNKRDVVNLSNFIRINVLDDLQRIPGVGDAFIFGEKRYSIRVWLIPDKLAKYNLTPLDVYSVIQSQNKQFIAGGLAQEPLSGHPVFSYSVKAESRLKTVEQFKNIIIRSNPHGARLKLKDIAEIRLGSESYGMKAFHNKIPTIPVGIYLSPGANALTVAKAVDTTLKKISKNLPDDIKYHIPYDPSVYVHESVKEVIFTLGLSILLVIIVVFMFLGNFRATFIPVIAIPVSIIGTFAGLYMAGFSVNLLTLFGLILSIGLVVDDAIVVIENVERILRQGDVSVKEATLRAMEEITAPVIAIVFVLSAVFIPASFVGGFSGKMYQQFAVTIAISVVISGFVALTLTPALCVVFLKKNISKPFFPIAMFQKFFDFSAKLFGKSVKIFIKLSVINVFLFIVMIYFCLHFGKKLPRGLVPYEDKGSLFVMTYLMPGSSLNRTEKVMHKIEDILLANKHITQEVSLAGIDLTSFSYKTDSGISFVHLSDWSERKGKALSSSAIALNLVRKFFTEKEALIFAFSPPPIRGMSITGGFEAYIQDRTGGSLKKLHRYVAEIIKEANSSKELMSVRTTLNTNVPQYYVTVDREKAKALNVNINRIYQTLAMTFSKTYINDFNLFGRTFHVNMEAKGNYRDSTDDYRNIFVRADSGSLVPVSSLISIKRTVDADIVQRFNMFTSAKITGQAKPGFTSNDAMKKIENIAKKVLPKGYTVAWAGTSYQEKKFQKTGNTAFIYGVIFILLILVALYESWSAPFAIILTVPFGLFGAILGMYLRGLESDIYFQVGIITLIGLTAKNAILIVEFAEERLKKKKMPLLESTVEAAQIRFRPIIMTSLAFIAGAVPLAISTGAGANSRHIIGTTVVSGMIFATVVGIFYIPFFYHLVMKFNLKFKKGKKEIEK